MEQIIDDEGRMDALRKSAEARRCRADAMGWIYGTIKAGSSVSFAEVEGRYGSQDWFKRTKVERVFRAIPGIGTKTAPRVMSVLGLDRSKRVGGLGNRQMASMASKFDELASASAKRHMG